MTRAPIKLSRELKLLLLLLLMVALIGAWYLWTNSRATSALAQPDGTPVASGPAGTEPDPASAGTAALPEGDGDVVPLTAGSPGGSDTVTLDVQPNRPVEVEVIPPFPTPQVEDAGSEAAAAVASGGINPQANLATVPRNNPFRPLTLDPSTQTATAPAVSPDAASGAGTDPEFTTPLTRSPEPQPIPTASSNVGPLALSPIPGADSSVDVSSGDTTGLPVIPGGDGSTEVGARPETTVSGNTPGRTVSGTSSDSGVTVIGASGNVSGSSDQGSVVVTAPKPIVPPVAGVRVPSVSRVPVVADRTAADSAGGSGANGTSGSAAATTGRPSTPSAPQIIAELAQAAGEGSAAATAASKLDQFVQTRGLVFNAAVLGPINTAIFRSQDGYVVVAVGQNLPDSQITVKEVDATSATLSLGNDLKTLELDQR